MKIGLLFAGQGAQYPGMGKELYDAFPAARGVFDAAGDELKNVCFFGDKEALRRTDVTQPAVLTVTAAAYAAFTEKLREEGLLPADGRATAAAPLEIAGVAGFSMGEYAALAAAGALPDFETTLALIGKRGAYMAEAGRNADGSPRGGMLAVLGERAATLGLIDAARGSDVLEGVNFNAPGQTVAAGDDDALRRLAESVRQTPGMKAVPLSVGTAFHCEIMRPASARLAAALSGLPLAAPRVPLYSNITGRDLMADKPEGTRDADWIAARMALQLACPVYWQETLENMARDGVAAFVEFGPGRTLSGFVKKTCPDVPAVNVEDVESLEKAARVLRELSRI